MAVNIFKKYLVLGLWQLFILIPFCQEINAQKTNHYCDQNFSCEVLHDVDPFATRKYRSSDVFGVTYADLIGGPPIVIKENNVNDEMLCYLEVENCLPISTITLNVRGMNFEFNDDGLNYDQTASDNVYTISRPSLFVTSTTVPASENYYTSLAVFRFTVTFEDGSTQSLLMRRNSFIVTEEYYNYLESRIPEIIETPVYSFLPHTVFTDGFTFDSHAKIDSFYNSHWEDEYDLLSYLRVGWGDIVGRSLSGANTLSLTQKRVQIGLSVFTRNLLLHELNHIWVNKQTSPFNQSSGHWHFIEKSSSGFGKGCYNGVFDRLKTENSISTYENEPYSSSDFFYNDLELFLMKAISIDEVQFPLKYVNDNIPVECSSSGSFTSGEVMSISKSEFLAELETKPETLAFADDTLQMRTIVTIFSYPITDIEKVMLDEFAKVNEDYFNEATRGLAHLNTTYEVSKQFEDKDQDGFFFSEDCDDNNPAVNPDAVEECDGVDNNCNGSIDEGLTTFMYYQDLDGDSYGSSVTYVGCSQPTGYVNISGDCNDNNSAINPAAQEVCDGVDNDCNGQIDDTLSATTWYQDSDGDGWGSSVSLSDCFQPTGYVSRTGDCDDNNSSVNPGAQESCNNIDDNCNGQIDEGLPLTTYYEDLDNDGFGSDVIHNRCFQPNGFVIATGDCNDNNAAINPGATDIPDNGIDEDCDGTDATAFVDNDGDGVTNETDCDDNDPDNFPGNLEICDGQDNNCDQMVDEGLTFTTYYSDNDRDGYGVDGTGFEDCSGVQPPDTTTEAGDCDDNDDSVFPGADEICDEKDNNCDGSIDEGLTFTTYYLDNDGDSFGDITTVFESCEITFLGAVDNGDDCDDTNPNINPGATEIPNNGIDEDCDGIDLLSSTHEISNATVSIYPNPVSDVIYIKVDGQLNFSSTLLNIRGKRILSSRNTNQIQVNTVPSGTYMLEIKDINTGLKVVERIIVR